MLNLEQKINEIYDYVEKKKKQEKRDLIVKWIIRIIFILYIVYVILVMLPDYMEKYKKPIEQLKNILSEKNLDNIDTKQKNMSEKLKRFMERKRGENAKAY